VTLKVAHIVPYDGIGGVETAVRSLPAGLHDDVVFHKVFIGRRGEAEDGPFEHHGALRNENHPANYLRAFVTILRIDPDILILSLWRSCALGVVLKLVRPRAQLVPFLHYPQTVHLADRLLSTWALALAAEVWVDSQATLEGRVPNQRRWKARTMSFLTRRVTPSKQRAPAPRFVFWGRLHHQKRLDRALDLIALLRGFKSNVTFDIIGPDGGAASDLKARTEDLGLSDCVRFWAARSWEEISEIAAKHSFYLQTSEQEGMAMSVVEAMQMGLVPVVTPVGEIARYCRDGENAVLLGSDIQSSVQRIVQLLDAPDQYAGLSHSAVRTWSDKPLYRDDVLAACRELGQGARA
jgi:glycosyltransferase involved in cell wall biosynthesis